MLMLVPVSMSSRYRINLRDSCVSWHIVSKADVGVLVWLGRMVYI